MQLKPQDFLVALKLAAWGNQRWTYATLSQAIGLSSSEVHSSVKRGLQAGLLAQNFDAAQAKQADDVVNLQASEIYRQGKNRKRLAQTPSEQSSSNDNPAVVHTRNLAEFAVHGAKFVFIAERSQLTIGIPTSHSAPAFAGIFAPGSVDYVWPHPNGQLSGMGVSPLHPCVPFAAMQDAKLYEMLALFDALRVGRARERGMALKRLPLLIYPGSPASVERPMHG